MPDTARLNTLGTRIREARDDLIDLTRSLVRLPTVNPPGEGYREICDLLQSRLCARGFVCRRYRAEGTPGDCDSYPRWNLLARHTGRYPGDCVHFNSHTDVVAPGAGWRVDPFAGRIEGDRLYGRGSCDMKGGLAASIVAAEVFIDTYPGYAGSIEISATCDEESGGFGGVAWLAERGFFDPARVQHVIIPEPLDKDRICLGHRGVWWAEIETVGHMAHGSMPFLGNCAVRHMGAVLEAFEQRLYPRLDQRRTSLPVVPAGARHSTMNINSLHGGLGEYTDADALPAALVPDSCRMVIDRRFLMEEDLDTVRAEVRGILEAVKRERQSFDYRMRELYAVLPSLTEREAPVVQAVAGAVREHFGRDADYVVSPGTYDQKHIDRIARMHNCIAYGPGILSLAHQPDEYVGIGDMVDAASVMARTLAALLAGMPYAADAAGAGPDMR